MTSMTSSGPQLPPQDWIARRSKVVTSRRGLPAISATDARPRSRRQNAPVVQNKMDNLCTTELHSLFRDNSFEQHFQPSSTVLLHDEPADAMYLVVSGTVRCCTIDSEGSRQIFRFATKGEFIGISDTNVWHFTAEAVDHVILKAIPREIVERNLKMNLALREEFREQTRHLLECREQQLLSLISKKAPERLLHFLCDFASSRPAAGTGAVALPMCRRDIADHLGLSVETVSRAFTDLKLKGRIELVSSEKYRIVQGIDHATLKPADPHTV